MPLVFDSKLIQNNLAWRIAGKPSGRIESMAHRVNLLCPCWRVQAPFDVFMCESYTKVPVIYGIGVSQLDSALKNDGILRM